MPPRREAFSVVHQLQQVHPDRPEAVAFESALAALVDAAAASPEAVDAAYYELEDMHAKAGALLLQTLFRPSPASDQKGLI